MESNEEWFKRLAKADVELEIKADDDDVEDVPSGKVSTLYALKRAYLDSPEMGKDVAEMAGLGGRHNIVSALQLCKVDQLLAVKNSEELKKTAKMFHGKSRVQLFETLQRIGTQQKQALALLFERGFDMDSSQYAKVQHYTIRGLAHLKPEWLKRLIGDPPPRMPELLAYLKTTTPKSLEDLPSLSALKLPRSGPAKGGGGNGPSAPRKPPSSARKQGQRRRTSRLLSRGKSASKLPHMDSSTNDSNDNNNDNSSANGSRKNEDHADAPGTRISPPKQPRPSHARRATTGARGVSRLARKAQATTTTRRGPRKARSTTKPPSNDDVTSPKSTGSSSSNAGRRRTTPGRSGISRIARPRTSLSGGKSAVRRLSRGSDRDAMVVSSPAAVAKAKLQLSQEDLDELGSSDEDEGPVPQRGARRGAAAAAQAPSPPSSDEEEEDDDEDVDVLVADEDEEEEPDAADWLAPSKPHMDDMRTSSDLSDTVPVPPRAGPRSHGALSARRQRMTKGGNSATRMGTPPNAWSASPRTGDDEPSPMAALRSSIDDELDGLRQTCAAQSRAMDDQKTTIKSQWDLIVTLKGSVSSLRKTLDRMRQAISEPAAPGGPRPMSVSHLGSKSSRSRNTAKSLLSDDDAHELEDVLDAEVLIVNSDEEADDPLGRRSPLGLSSIDQHPKVKMLSRKVTRLERQIRALKDENEALSRKNAATPQATSGPQSASLIEENSQLRDEVTTLRSDRQSLVEHLREMEEQLRNQTQKATEVTSELREQLEAQREVTEQMEVTKVQDMKRLRDRAAVRAEEHQQLAGQLATSIEECEELRRRCDELEEENEALLAKARGLTQSAGGHADDLRVYEERITEQDDEITALRRQLEEVTAERDDLKTSVSFLDDEHRKSAQKVAQLENEVEHLKSQLERENADDNDNEDDDNNSSSSSRGKRRGSGKGTPADRRRLAQLEASKKKLERRVNQLSNVNNKNKDLEQRVRELTAELEAKGGGAAAAASAPSSAGGGGGGAAELQKLKELTEQLKEENAYMAKEMQNGTKQRRALQQQLDAKTEELLKLQK